MTLPSLPPGESPAQTRLDAVWEILIEVDFAPEVSVSTVEVLQARLWKTLNAVLRQVLGPHLYEPAGLEVHEPAGRGKDTPLFPMVAGNTRFTCNVDVVEMLEMQCADTDLAKMGFDARGHAYDLIAQIKYLRRPEHDREGAAETTPPRSTVN